MLIESQDIEYKEAWRDEYLKWVCGFANAQGGRIYIGVNDDRRVVGVADAQRLLEDIPNKIATNLGIVADVNLLHEDGLDYIEILVEPSNMPIAYHGIYHYRSGSTKQELKGAALQQFILKKMGRSWDDIAMDRATLDDIDRQAVEYFLRKGIEAGRIPEGQSNSSTEEVLTNMHLIDEDGRLKNAALLLFGKDPLKFFTSVRFKIGRFGADDADLLVQDVVEGNIIQMADRVLDILKAKYLVSPIRFEGMQRKERLEIPLKALREMLYNAIAHKDYTGPDIQMHVYDDHVEIWNEGALPAGYNEVVLYGKHSSKPRNRNIADVMFKAGFIDTWGRGYSKIRDGFKEAGLPTPTVTSHCGGTLVSFQRGYDVRHSKTNVSDSLPRVSDNVSVDVSDNVSDASIVQLTDRQRRICEIVKADPTTSGKRMSEMLSVTQRTIWRDLSQLQQSGILLREGNARFGRWLILSKQ